VSGQVTQWENGRVPSSGVLEFNGEGQILGFVPLTAAPTDIEAFPSGNEFAVVTEAGELLIFSGKEKTFSLVLEKELHDVDVLEEPSRFLLTSRAAKKVFFYDVKEQTKREIDYPFEGPTDADLLPGGNLLICDSTAGSILEIAEDGTPVWSYNRDLLQPMDALRLPNGNTLISDFDHHRLLEISPREEIVSEQTGFDHPVKMSLLPSGDVLVADADHRRLMKRKPNGTLDVVRENLNCIQAAIFLPDQNLYLCATIGRFPQQRIPPQIPPQIKQGAIPASGAQRPFRTLLHDYAFNSYSLLALAFVFFVLAGRRIGPRILTPLAYALVLSVSYRSLTAAVSVPPYHPDYPFWIGALFLALFCYRDVCHIYLPGELWFHGGNSPCFPFSIQRSLILVVLSIAGLFCQYLYLNGRGLPWYLAVILWLVGLWVLLAPCFPVRNNGDSSKTVVQIGSVSFALPFSVRENTDSDFSRANTFVLLIILLAACLYMIRLTDFPTDVHGDSAEVALHGIEVRDSGQWTIFDPGWYQIPNLFFLIPACVMWLFGDNLFGMRMADALIALATIPLFYLTARRLFSKSASVLATFLFATSTYVIHYARLGIGYNQTACLTIAVLYCLLCGLQNNEAKAFSWAGWIAGLGLLSYQASHLLLPLMLATLGLFFLTRRIPLKTTWIYTVTFLLAFWVTVAPLVGSFLVSPNALFSRANGVSIFSQEGRRMIRQSYPPDISNIDMIRGQLERSLLSPISYPDGSPYLINRVSGGILDPLPAMFLISGTLILFLTLTYPATLIFLFWIPVTLITGSVLTNNAPSYQRLVGLVPLLILVAAPIPCAIGNHLKRCCTWSPRVHSALLCAFLAFLLITGIGRYFHKIMAQPQMVDQWTRIAHYLKDAGPTSYTYFFGPPYVYFKYGTIRFLAPVAKGEDVLKPEEFLRQKISRRGPVSFLLVHSHRRYIEDLRRLYPGGKEEIHTNCLGQEPFITYEVNL